MEPVLDADQCGFEDYSLSTEMERLTFAIEQAAEKWLCASMCSTRLSGLTDGRLQDVTSAVEGVIFSLQL